MKRHAFILCTAAIFALGATNAHAQRVRAARDNVAGGLTAGGAHDVRGPFGGRTVGEGGVVANGDGAGVAGSRGCARTGAGARRCGASATAWDEDGNIRHEQSGYAEGVFGNTARSEGSFERNENGDWTGNRDTEVNIGDRTYSIDTNFESGEGISRDVDCNGSGC